MKFKKKFFILFLILITIFPLCVSAHNLDEVTIGAFINRVGGTTWMMPGYYSTVKFNDGSSKNSSAFCLDSSRETPSVINATNGDIWQLGTSYMSNDYDAGLYGIYLTFYEYVKNNGGGYINNYRAYYEAAARALGQYYGNERLGGRYDEYSQCKTAVINNTPNNLDSCFGTNQVYFPNVRAFYSSAFNLSSIRNKGESVIPKITLVSKEIDENNILTFKFNLELNGMYNSESYPGIVLDGRDSYKDINNPYFFFEKFTLKINGTQIWFTNADIIKYSTNHQQQFNSNQELVLSLDLNVINARFGETAQIEVGVDYRWSHPLNPNNVFIFQPNNYMQRMLIITDYLENNFLTFYHNYSGDVPVTDIEENKCKQEGNKFYFDNLEIDIYEYKTKCGCEKIDLDEITRLELKDIYNSVCAVNESEYTSTLDSCDNEAEIGKNTLSHTYKKSVQDNNMYCTLNCKETVNVEDFTDRYSVLAGKYFELNKYPKLVATKKCSVDVKYDEWVQEYEDLLENYLLEAVNEAIIDYAIDNPNSNSRVRCCRRDGTNCDTDVRYDYQYSTYSLVGNEIRQNTTLTSGSYYRDGVCGNDKPSTNSYSVNDNAVSVEINKLEEHFKKLRTCNKYLNSLGRNYYKFVGDLNFYYRQEYSNLGLLWNNSKPNGEVDDSSFTMIVKTDEGYNSNGYKEESGPDNNYNEFTADSYGYPYISGINYSSSGSSGEISNYLVGTYKTSSYTINRTSNFAASYKPSVVKYVDAYSGIVSSSRAYLNNPIHLGNVYDTSVTAVSRNDNDNYYQFKSLGDNNNIYRYFMANNDYKLKRYCKYEIKNEILTPQLNVLYRIVDPGNVDPNNRLGSDNGFKNWNNDKGKAVMAKIESDAVGSNIYKPDNLEYSFELDSAKIKEIRENSRNEYFSFNDYDCDNYGNKCISDFVKDYAIKDNNGILVGNGRNSWKEFRKDTNTGKCYIKYSTGEEEVPCS